jgi:hypothetical protein
MMKKTMNTKIKFIIPAVAVTFAIIFAISPMVMADKGGFAMWGGQRHHNQGHGILIDGFAGNIAIPADITADTHDLLKSQVSVTLAQAVSTAEANGFTNAQRAGLGSVVDAQGNQFLAWIVTSAQKDATSGSVTTNIFAVDAGNADNFATTSQTFDHSMGKVGDRAAMFEQFKQKFSEPTGDPTVDAARAHYLDLMQQLMDAKKNGDNDTANSIKSQLQELRQTFHSMEHPTV